MYLVIDEGFYVFLEVDPRQNGCDLAVLAEVELDTYPPQGDTLNWLLDRTPQFPFLGKWSENQFCVFSTSAQVEQQGYEMLGFAWHAYRDWSEWLQAKPGLRADQQKALVEVSAAVARLEGANSPGIIARGWQWLRSCFAK
jgi:hypothetical protein